MSGVTGKRILVLEDEVLLALDAADALSDIGVVVIGPAHRIDAAMMLLDAGLPDAALLDVNIRGTTSVAVAERLAAAGVPYILATGYGAQSDVKGAMEIIDKPYSPQQLQDAFSRLFAK